MSRPPPEGTVAYEILWSSQSCHRTPHLLNCSGVAHGGWLRPLPKARRMLEDRVIWGGEVSCLFLRRAEGFSPTLLLDEAEMLVAAEKMYSRRFAWRIRCLNHYFLRHNTAESASSPISSFHQPARTPLLHTRRSRYRAALPRGDTPPLPANCTAGSTQFEVVTPGIGGKELLSRGFSEAGCRTSHQPELEFLVLVFDKLDGESTMVDNIGPGLVQKDVDEGPTSLH
ncbi:hypothetical protein LY78DRAFT_403021 [Colletotrichum sublineola]|nr:hypothetical protein LY78DRAFT_403021 [Colletotrichum sublineola]